MKHTLFMPFLIFFVTIVSWEARAQVVEAPPPSSTHRPWSVGAGIGYSFTPSWGATASAGMAGRSSVQSPFGAVLLEKQLSRNLALLFDVYGGFADYDNDIGEDVWGSLIDQSYHAGASAGIRWIFNPGGIVEISGIISASGLFSGSKSENIDSVQEGDAESERLILKGEDINYSVGLELGLALERKLLDNLYLRFQSSLLGGYWGVTDSTEETIDGPDEEFRRRLVSIGLAFTPMIQLRMEI